MGFFWFFFFTNVLFLLWEKSFSVTTGSGFDGYGSSWGTIALYGAVSSQQRK
jgi:hypothetical protein